jgi:hypothetical protein
MCCVSLSTSHSEFCIHVLCYFIHLTFWLLYPCAVLLYPRHNLIAYPCAVLLYAHHLLIAASLCCVTLSTSPSDSCIHVFCYFIHITFQMLYPCAILLYPHVTFWLPNTTHVDLFFLHISYLFCFLKCSNNEICTPVSIQCTSLGLQLTYLDLHRQTVNSILCLSWMGY